MRPRTPKEKQEKPFRHGCVQAGHARIETLRREPLIRAPSVRKAKGPAYSQYLHQAVDRICRGKRRAKPSDASTNIDPLFDRAVQRVHRRLFLTMLPIEVALTGVGFLLLYRPSRQLLMAVFLAFPLFALVRTLLRHLVSRLIAPTDVLIRREYERLNQSAS